MTRLVPGVVNVVSRVTWEPEEKQSRRTYRHLTYR
jgi:hypothetical protein